MADLASLVISLEGRIGNLDQTMRQASELTTRNMKSIEDSVGRAKGAMLSLAASVVSVAAVMQSVRAAVQLGDNLKQMSDQTGIAIDKLDKLDIIAKLNGASLQTFAVAQKALTKSMVEAGDATSKTGKLYAELGISVKDAQGNLRATDDVLADVAKALSGIENETTRAAVGTALLGKSYSGMSATLRNYEEDQKKANEILEQFGGVSVQAANLADNLGDKFTLLSEGSKRAFLQGLVPGLAAVGQVITEITNKGGEFQRNFGDTISTVATAVSKSIVALTGTFEVLGTTIGAVMAAIATRSLQPLKDLPGDLDKIEAKIKGAMARIGTAAKFPGLDEGDQASRAAGAADRLAEAQAKLALNANKLNKILGEGKAKQDEYAKAMDTLTKSVAGAEAEMLAFTSQTEDLVPLQKQLAEIMASDQWKKAPQAWKDQYEAMAKVGIASQQALRDFKQLADAAAEFAAQRKKDNEEWLEQQNEIAAQTRDMVNDYELQNDALERQLAIVGQDERAHELLAATLEFESREREILAARTLDNAAAMDVELEKLREQFARRSELINKTFDAEGFKRTFDEMTSIASDFFVDLFENGSDAFAHLWDYFKRTALRALADIAAKQVVVSIVGALGGTVGGTAAAAGGGGLGGLGDLASLAGLGGNFIDLKSLAATDVGSIFGGTAPVSSAGWVSAEGGLGYGATLGSTLGTAAVGAGIGYGVGTLSNMAFGNARNQQGMQIGGTIGGIAGSFVAGPLGALIGSALGSAIGSLVKSGGGAKIGGAASLGNLEATGLISRITPGRFGEDASIKQADAQLQATVKTVSDSYNALIKGFGGSMQEAGFGLAFDTGKYSPNRVKAGVTVGGKSVYALDTGEGATSIGRDPAVLEARLATESKRMLLAALQASDLPDYLSNLFDGLEVATATQEQIDNVIAAAVAIAQAVEIIPQLDTAFANLKPEDIMGLVDAFGGIEQLSASMQAFGQNFTTTAERVEKAQENLEAAFEDLGLAVPETHQAFKDLLQSFDLATEEGRKLYASVMGLSGAFVSVKGTADQAAQALKQSFSEVRALADKIRIPAGGGGGGGITAGSSSLGVETALALAKGQRDEMVRQFAETKPWAQQFLGERGTGGFIQNLANITEADFGAYSAKDQKMIAEILGAQARLDETQQAALDVYAEGAGTEGGSGGRGGGRGGDGSFIDQTDALRGAAADMLGIFKQFAELSTGDYAEKLTLQLQMIDGAWARAADVQKGVYSDAAQNLSASYRLFESLRGEHGDAIAEQLTRLSETYRGQQQQLGDNVQGLEALRRVFDEQWEAIIAGTAEGVDGTLDQLLRLNEGILDYVDSLRISADSPLPPMQRLAEAQRQYEETLSRAQAKDLDALGEITNAAENFRAIGRDVFASSQAYTDIFNRITSDLTALAGGTAPAPFQALGTNTPLSARTDVGAKAGGEVISDEIANLVAELIERVSGVIIESGSASANKIAAAVDSVKAAVNESMTFGKK